ncbi:hypothetical protein ACFU8I_33505 [Streptomyces sp. NPDC057540]|uniref:DUF7302 family protein n=1 Tax=Streptomyces sp. NPDC057540 TaxID=3346160 RepID=UPI0036BE2297
MRIRMLTTLPGTRHGEPWPDKGTTVDVPDEEAEQLIRYGAAEPADPEPGPEPDAAPAEPAKPSRKTARPPQ